MRRLLPAAFFALGAGYAALYALGGVRLGDVLSLWWIALVGLFGASVANSTGTGGGVVFVPAFTALAQAGGPPLSPSETVAASVLIQCFGMSMGTLSWLSRFAGASPVPLGVPRAVFWRIVALTLAATLPALWATQALAEVGGTRLLLFFKSFSVVLGLVLLASLARPEGRAAWRAADAALLVVVGAAGGVATALFSVGVGELLAVALFLRGYSLSLSVASAVVVSAVTVLAAAPHALGEIGPHLAVVAAAAPGVLVGGWLGRRLALALGPRRLKLGAGLWITGSSLFLIVRAAG